jgi:hypothetical protein
MLAPPKYGKSSYSSGEAHEMKSRGGKSTNETIVVEENESRYKGATANDRHDMDRVGKTQELTVRLRSVTAQAQLSLL